MIIKSNLDLSYIITMSGGDPSTAKTLLQALLTELKNNRLTARKLCDKKDWAGLDRFCHNYKSTLSYSGDQALINANLQLWEVAHAQGADQQTISKLLATLEKNSQKVALEVNRILKNL